MPFYIAMLLAVSFLVRSDEELRTLGMQITDATQSVMMANVRQAIDVGGPPHAVAFCTTRAMTLVDSLSKVHNVEIRRTTLMPRNAANAPTAHEERVLRRMAYAADRGQLPPSVLETIDDTLHFYRPIVLARPCLACHGDPEKDITAETLSVIESAYPSDMATGYSEGDLRGMWHLVFKQ
jgi:hypothetical protein